MNREEFAKELDMIFKKYSNMKKWNKLLSLYEVEEIRRLNDYVMKHYQDDILIFVYGYEIVNDKVILKTELGSFLLDLPKLYDLDQVKRQLAKIVNQKKNLLDFFEMLIRDNIFVTDYMDTENGKRNYCGKVQVLKGFTNKTLLDSNVILKDYLDRYFIYRMLKEPEKYAKKFFRYYNQILCKCSYYFPSSKDFSGVSHVLPLDFHYYIYTNEACAAYFNTLYDHYYSFDQNLSLLFSIIILLNQGDKISIIKKHLEEFKKFIMEEGLCSAFSGRYSFMAYDFLKTNQLLSYFTEEELKKIYMKDPKNSFRCLKEVMLPIALGIENISPMVRLRKSDSLMVHLCYHDYDLYEGEPTLEKKELSFEKRGGFLSYFLSNNEIVVKLYKMYYKGYLKLIGDNLEKDNIEDFLETLLKPNNLLSIFENRKFSFGDLRSLSSFQHYYGKEVEESIRKVTEVLRRKSLAVYNEIILARDSLEKMNGCLAKYGLTSDNIYEYVIGDKFLYSKEKNGLLHVVYQYYGKSLKVLDILLLLDEMLNREMTLEQILKEKEIPKRDFQRMYQQSIEDNPILYQCIFESLSQNKRRGYLKLIRFGYRVLHTSLCSMEEYEKEFGEVISYNKLLAGVQDTELYSLLLEKSSHWKDLNKGKIKRLEKKEADEC